MWSSSCRAEPDTVLYYYFCSLPLKTLSIGNWLTRCTATMCPMGLLQSLGWPCSLLLVRQKISTNQLNSRPSMYANYYLYFFLHNALITYNKNHALFIINFINVCHNIIIMDNIMIVNDYRNTQQRTVMVVVLINSMSLLYYVARKPCKRAVVEMLQFSCMNLENTCEM